MSPILSTILSATWEKKTNKFTGYNPVSLGNLHNYEPHDNANDIYQLEDF